jgi:hypothetical protein
MPAGGRSTYDDRPDCSLPEADRYWPPRQSKTQPVLIARLKSGERRRPIRLPKFMRYTSSSVGMQRLRPAEAPYYPRQ